MASYQFRSAEGAAANSPLIFLFHGTGGDENQFFDFAAELVPEAKSFISARPTEKPRPTASRATLAPLMPPPMTKISTLSLAMLQTLSLLSFIRVWLSF